MPLFEQGEKLTLEGDFSSYFDVRVPKGYETEAYQLLTPDVMANLIDKAKDINFEFSGNKMYIYVPRLINDSEGMRSMFILVDYLAGMFKHNASEIRTGPDTSPQSARSQSASGTAPLMPVAAAEQVFKEALTHGTHDPEKLEDAARSLDPADTFKLIMAQIKSNKSFRFELILFLVIFIAILIVSAFLFNRFVSEGQFSSTTSFSDAIIPTSTKDQIDTALIPPSTPDASANDPSLLKGWDSMMLIATYIPKGFATTSISVSSGPSDQQENGHKYGGYAIQYCNADRSCFIIESNCDGLGDLDGGDEEATGTSPLFGEFTVELVKANSGDDDHDYVLSSWMEDPKFIEAEKENTPACDAGGNAHHLRGHGLTLPEAVKVVESLRAVN